MWGALTHTYLCINLPFIYKQKSSICRTCERLFRLADSSRLWASLNAHFTGVIVCACVSLCECVCLLGWLTVGNKHSNLFDFMLRYYLQFHCASAYNNINIPAPAPRPAFSPSNQLFADQNSRTHTHARMSRAYIVREAWHFVVWVEAFVYSCTLKSK